MSKLKTAAFVITDELKAWLERQAKADDRSVSYVVRKILEKERQKAETQKQSKK